jgi:plasmid stabilization system protein ParE
MFSVETTSRFDSEWEEILDFVAKDSVENALNFYDQIMDKLKALSENPFMYRQRAGMNSNIREMIYKGYTIPYFIDNDDNTIYVLGIFNQNLWV